jgi:cytochrome c oxidase assembly factor CtaG
MRKIAASFFLVTLASPAQAHGLEQPTAGAAWTFDPWIVAPLLAFGGMYAGGVLVLWRRTARMVSAHAWQQVACLAGWLTLTTALVSPLHWLGEHLFTFHMIEHEIIMAVSAPLIVLARPVGPLLWSLPRHLRLVTGRLMQHPASRAVWNLLSTGRNATLLHGIAIWAWHAPALFDAAVINIALHRLQHFSFFVTAVLFWWSVFRRSDTGTAAWHVFVTMLHTSILGALMALAPRVLYQEQTATAAIWGLSPLEDQQLAGIIMWVPAGTIYAGTALALMAIWIRRAGHNDVHADAANVL